jgi:hypothetical protein
MPVSAGRLVETTALHGSRREAVVMAQLRYSRGWQMRNPQLVRRDEMLASLTQDETSVAAFAPDMAGTFASATAGPERAVTWALALYETMLETSSVEDQEDAGRRAKDDRATKNGRAWCPSQSRARRR